MEEFAAGLHCSVWKVDEGALLELDEVISVTNDEEVSITELELEGNVVDSVSCSVSVVVISTVPVVSVVPAAPVLAEGVPEVSGVPAVPVVPVVVHRS